MAITPELLVYSLLALLDDMQQPHKGAALDLHAATFSHGEGGRWLRLVVEVIESLLYDFITDIQHSSLCFEESRTYGI